MDLFDTAILNLLRRKTETIPGDPGRSQVKPQYPEATPRLPIGSEPRHQGQAAHRGPWKAEVRLFGPRWLGWGSRCDSESVGWGGFS